MTTPTNFNDVLAQASSANLQIIITSLQNIVSALNALNTQLISVIGSVASNG